MKKVAFPFFFLLALLFSACSDNSLTPKDPMSALSASQVPTAVQSALTTNYPTATNTTWKLASPVVYQASFTSQNTQKLASIQSNGTVMYCHDQIDPATLPSAITDYLQANYQGYAIAMAGARKDKTTAAITDYMVEFTLNGIVYEVRFDASGNFLSLEMENGKQEGSEIAEADLPAAITSYLTSSYAGYTFQHARADKSNGTITGYGVLILYYGQPVGLLFDASGNFTSVEAKGMGNGGHGGGPGGPKGHGPGPNINSVLLADLPATITSYLDTNYSGYTFGIAISKLNGATIVGYDVSIAFNGMKYVVEFDGNGKFLRAH